MESAKIGEGKVVCVTGASGFIASWLVKLLLHRGYTVNATVRNLKDTSKVAHLLALDGANERLRLFTAELLEERSFDPAVDGCEGVFHTASPSTGKSKEEYVDPAVKGTLNVLRSCAKSPSVRRVVITSSTSSVIRNKNMSTPGTVADETCYSDPEFCEQKKEWYNLSKTLAEQAAWKFAKENGIDLVTLHPGLVIGPLLQPTLNSSCEVIVNVIKQGKEWSNGIYGFVDVRDVANAHILAFEVPSANGRYCLVGANGYSSSLLKIVQKLYPSITLSENFEENGLPLSPAFEISGERAKTIGVKFTRLELSVKDTVESLIQNNFLKILPQN